MPYTASLLWTRLTSHGKLYSMFCPQTFHVRETSPGKNKIFLSMCLPHLLQAIPGSIGTSTCCAALSLLTALYVISVRQTGDLPTPSFRFYLTADTLGVQLYPSHYRAGSGLSPVRFCPCRAHTDLRASGISASSPVRALLMTCSYRPGCNIVKSSISSIVRNSQI